MRGLWQHYQTTSSLGVCQRQPNVDTLGNHSELCGRDFEVFICPGRGRLSTGYYIALLKAAVIYTAKAMATRAGVVFLWGAAGLGEVFETARSLTLVHAIAGDCQSWIMW